MEVPHLLAGITYHFGGLEVIFSFWLLQTMLDAFLLNVSVVRCIFK
jgi:hypothetical protein